MSRSNTVNPAILPRAKWWWVALCLLLLLAGWLYLRGYNVSLPYIDQIDEPLRLLAAQHLIDDGSARAVGDEAYPPGMSRLNYLFLKHIKAPEAHHGTMLPALRLITIAAWMLAVAVIALLGALMAHPLTGLMAAAIWIVNPWVVYRAHFALPDGYLTLFTLLSLWLALVGSLHGRRSFSTAAVYSLMLAIVFKTTALFVAPFVLFLPLVALRRLRLAPVDAWQQIFWNCFRFAIFLFWLFLLHPTLDTHTIPDFVVTEKRIFAPQFTDLTNAYLFPLLLKFQPLPGWIGIALLGVLLLRYRKQVNNVALVIIGAAFAAWLIAMSMLSVLPDYGELRQLFAPGAMLSLLYAAALTSLYFAGEELLARFKPLPIAPRLQSVFLGSLLGISLGIGLLPSYQESDEMAHNFTLHDRRNDLMRYMDTSVEPGMYLSIGENHKTFNRSWGGYDGLHDFPRHKELALLTDKPIDEWRQLGVEYAIMPHKLRLLDPDIYYPDETTTLKTYPVDSNFRGPDMVVLRLYPIQHETTAQLGPIRLLGYDINTTQLQAGKDIVIRHYWQADKPTNTIHHVYNHLLDANGAIVAQTDYAPLWDARRPTTTWNDPEEIMLGREFVVSLPEDIPPGSYQLVSGWYDPLTWGRLTNDDGEDRLWISEIEVLGI